MEAIKRFRQMRPVMDITRDVGVKIVIDTMMQPGEKKMIKLKFDELLQTAIVSGFYAVFIEDAVFMFFSDDPQWGAVINFLVAVFGKTIGNILAKIIWNTLLNFGSKAGSEMLIQSVSPLVDSYSAIRACRSSHGILARPVVNFQS